MTTLFLIVAVSAAFFAAERLFGRYALRNVSYDARVSKTLLEQGERFELITEIVNAKRLPEFFVELTEKLPNGVEPLYDGAVLSLPDGRTVLKRSFYMMPMQKLTGRISAVVNKRGRYIMREAEMLGGDFLGLSSVYRRFPLFCCVSVMPRRFVQPKMSRLLGGFMGEVSVNRFIMPDPVLTVGVAEYTGREPQKDVNWPQSARAGRLLVSKRDFTTEPAVTVLLDTETTYPKDSEAIETCLSIARTVVEDLCNKGVKFGFMTNAVSVTTRGLWKDGGGGGGGGDGSGRCHAENILECLACCSYDARETARSLLKRAREKAEQGRSHVIISARGLADCRADVDRLKYLTGGAVLTLSPDMFETGGTT